jgi:acyl carrier protein
VFPGHSPQELEQATPDRISTWDSTNHFMLLQVVEEEFGVSVSEDLVAELASFGDFEQFLGSKN